MRDIFKHKQRFDNFQERVKEEGSIEGISKENSNIILRFLKDMQEGKNTGKGSKKGAREPATLNKLSGRLIQISRWLEERGIKNIIEDPKKTEQALLNVFNDLRNGVIKTKKGKNKGSKYKSVDTYAKCFVTFWKWWMVVNRKEDIIIRKITEDLNTASDGDPTFVYSTKEQIEQIIPYFTEEEQLIILFCFDSMIRSPTELLNLEVKDIYEEEGETWVNIPDNIAKGHRGRRFNLLLCGDSLKKYIGDQVSDDNAPLFLDGDIIKLNLLNKKLQQVAVQEFGDKISHTKAGGLWSEFTLRDLRHSGGIHLRILAQKDNRISLDSIRERGGWVNFKMLNYYTRFLGLTGKINREATIIEIDKTQMQKKIDELTEEVKQSKLIVLKVNEDMKDHNEFYKMTSEFMKFQHEKMKSMGDSDLLEMYEKIFKDDGTLFKELDSNIPNKIKKKKNNTP